MGDLGKTYCLTKLRGCTSLTELRTVWESLAHAYQRDPEISGLKDTMKAKLQ